MQRIERYGVIALVFLLVTILAVSLWGERESGSLLSLFRGAPKAHPAPPEDTLLPSDEPPALVVGERPATSRTLPLGAQAPADAWSAPAFHPEALARAPLRSPDPVAPRPERAEDLASRAVLAPEPVPATIAPPRQQARATLAPSRSAPPAGSRSYVVKAGETLGEIAQRELGTWRRWTEIQALNGGLDPSKLRAGVTLHLPVGGGAPSAKAPEARTAAAQAPAPAGRSYEVRPGDTLSAIAARELGDEERWREIQALNPKLDPRRLLVGQRLALPAGAAPAERPVALARNERKASDGPRVR